MFNSIPVTAVAASLLLLPSTFAEGLYPKSSPVLNIDHRKYQSWIANSNHTSIVEFYAPWCGHCKNLKPAYEKAAKSLAGLANVAAVNCDDEENKQFCGSMGVQGFPTLKIIRPGKTRGKPAVEEYKTYRTTKAIVESVISAIPNHVKRLKDTEYADWVADGVGPKAILFSDKGSAGGLLKAIAIDFLDALQIGQVRNNQKEAVEAFGIDKFPTLVLLPGGGKEPMVYDGEMKKEKMVAFLSQAATPNPDPIKEGKLPKSSESPKAKAKAKSSKAESDFKKSSASQASKQAKTDKASQTLETLEDEPTESPGPRVDTPKPVKVAEPATPIKSLPDALSLQQQCLNDKAATCILLLLSDAESDATDATDAVKSLSEIQRKHSSGGRKLFPFYQIPMSNSQNVLLRTRLEIGTAAIKVIAINGKRNWWRLHWKNLSYQDLENWIDAIRMGDIPKVDLPEKVIVNAEDLPAKPVEVVNDPKLADLEENLKKQAPDGLDFEFQELSDEDYEKLMKQTDKKGHDEL